MPTPMRDPLTRDRILVTALALIDAEGLERLTMRRLGQALGVEAMALYNHVAGKEEIVSGAVALVMAELEPVPADLPWKEALRRRAMAFHRALRRHPWAAGQMMNPARIVEPRLAWMDAVLGTLREAGCSVELAHHGFHILESHIIGSSLWLNSIVAPATGGKSPAALVDSPPFDRYPWLGEHMRYHLHLDGSPGGHEDADARSTFELGLEMIIDGIERLRAAP